MGRFERKLKPVIQVLPIFNMITRNLYLGGNYADR